MLKYFIPVILFCLIGCIPTEYRLNNIPIDTHFSYDVTGFNGLDITSISDNNAVHYSFTNTKGDGDWEWNGSANPFTWTFNAGVTPVDLTFDNDTISTANDVVLESGGWLKTVSATNQIRNQITAGTVNFGDEVLFYCPECWSYLRTELTTDSVGSYMAVIASDLTGAAISTPVLVIKDHPVTGIDGILMLGLDGENNPGGGLTPSTGYWRTMWSVNSIGFAPADTDTFHRNAFTYYGIMFQFSGTHTSSNQTLSLNVKNTEIQRWENDTSLGPRVTISNPYASTTGVFFRTHYEAVNRNLNTWTTYNTLTYKNTSSNNGNAIRAFNSYWYIDSTTNKNITSSGNPVAGFFNGLIDGSGTYDSPTGIQIKISQVAGSSTSNIVTGLRVETPNKSSGTWNTYHAITIDGSNPATNNRQIALQTGVSNPSALTDYVGLWAEDIDADDARIGIQSESGSPIYIGNNSLYFKDDSGIVSAGTLSLTGSEIDVTNNPLRIENESGDVSPGTTLEGQIRAWEDTNISNGKILLQINGTTYVFIADETE